MSGQAPFDYPFGYRSLTLNGHRNTDGSLKKGSYESDTILVTRFDPSRVQIRDQREPLHLIAGGDLGAASKGFRYISLSGLIKATTQAKLEDKISSIMSTFDIDECQLAYPETYGVSELTFYSETDVGAVDTVVQEQFYARPAGLPVMPERLSGGLIVPFAVELVCADPRRYRTAATVLTCSAAQGWTKSAPNWSAAMGATVYPVIVITMSGTGAANTRITSDAPDLVLNLATVGAGNTVTIDSLDNRITLGSNEAANLRTSPVSDWPLILPGGGTVGVTNPTGISQVVFTYRQARG